MKEKKNISDLVYENQELTGKEIIELYEKYKLKQEHDKISLKKELEELIKEDEIWMGKSFNYIILIKIKKISGLNNDDDRIFVYVDKLKIKVTHINSDNIEYKYLNNELELIGVDYFNGMKKVDNSLFDNIVETLKIVIPENFPEYSREINEIIDNSKKQQ